MEKFWELLNGLGPVAVCVRLIIAMGLGGILGLEREQLKRGAGFRTFIIVCVGSALATMTGIYMKEHGMSPESARIPAQIISGMGFLGAGTILVTRNTKVKGLTTAASLWTVACIGIAVGSGFYLGAILGTFMIVLSLGLLKLVEDRLDVDSREAQIYIEASSGAMVRKVAQYARSTNTSVYEFEISTIEEETSKLYAIIFFAKRHNKQLTWEQFINGLSEIDGVVFAQKL